MKSLVALLALAVALIVRLYQRFDTSLPQSIEHNPPRELQPIRVRITRK